MNIADFERVKTPFPANRFRTLADAQTFMKTGDVSLIIPAFIRDGDKVRVNPKWQSARWEEAIVRIDNVARALVRRGEFAACDGATSAGDWQSPADGSCRPISLAT